MNGMIQHYSTPCGCLQRLCHFLFSYAYQCRHEAITDRLSKRFHFFLASSRNRIPGVADYKAYKLHFIHDFHSFIYDFHSYMGVVVWQGRFLQTYDNDFEQGLNIRACENIPKPTVCFCCQRFCILFKTRSLTLSVTSVVINATIFLGIFLNISSGQA